MLLLKWLAQFLYSELTQNKIAYPKMRDRRLKDKMTDF